MVAPALGYALAGILKGLGQGRTQKNQRANQESQAKLLKAQADLAKTKNDLLQKYLDATGLGTPSQQAPSNVEDVLQDNLSGSGIEFGESFDEFGQGTSTGDVDELGSVISRAAEIGGQAQPQGQSTLPGGGDENSMLAAIKSITGIDLLGAKRLSQTKDLAEMREEGTQERFDISEARRESTKKFRESELVPFEFKTPGGDTRKGFRLKNETPQAAFKRLNDASQRKITKQITGGVPQAGPQTGGAGNTLLKSLGKLNKPLSPSERSGFVHEREGTKLPTEIKTMQEALDAGFVSVNVGTITQQAELKASLAIVDKLDNFVKEIFSDVKTPGDRISKALEKNLQVHFQVGGSTKPARYQRVKEAVLARIVRAFGERGTLTDQDIGRARALFPKLLPFPDKIDVANDLMGDLRELIHDVQNRSLETWTPPEGAQIIGSDFDVKGFMSQGGEEFSGSEGGGGAPLTAEELTKKLGL